MHIKKTDVVDFDLFDRALANGKAVSVELEHPLAPELARRMQESLRYPRIVGVDV